MGFLKKNMKTDNLIEVYKELGTYERHFNQIQNVFKGLSSTWFFTGFASIGFIYTSNFPESFPTKIELACTLLTLTIATGIILFWLLDVIVYHRLLLATLEESENLEKINTELPRLRTTMKKFTKTINARFAFSLFYIIPSLIMIMTSIIFLIISWSNNIIIINVLLCIWLSILIILEIGILFFQKRK